MAGCVLRGIVFSIVEEEVPSVLSTEYHGHGSSPSPFGTLQLVLLPIWSPPRLRCISWARAPWDCSWPLQSAAHFHPIPCECCCETLRRCCHPGPPSVAVKLLYRYCSHRWRCHRLRRTLPCLPNQLPHAERTHGSFRYPTKSYRHYLRIVATVARRLPMCSLRPKRIKRKKLYNRFVICWIVRPLLL
jgi:hypothetical protein